MSELIPVQCWLKNMSMWHQRKRLLEKKEGRQFICIGTSWDNWLPLCNLGNNTKRASSHLYFPCVHRVYPEASTTRKHLLHLRFSRKTVPCILLWSDVLLSPHLNVRVSLSASAWTILLSLCWYIVKFSHVDWRTSGSMAPSDDHFSSGWFSSPDASPEEALEVVLELEEELLSSCLLACWVCSSLQSGLEGRWMWPERVKSGWSDLIRICLKMSSRVRSGADKRSREYTSSDPFCEEWCPSTDRFQLSQATKGSLLWGYVTTLVPGLGDVLSIAQGANWWPLARWCSCCSKHLTLWAQATLVPWILHQVWA